MRTREETPPCWSCDCRKSFKNDQFVRAYVVSDTLDAFKSCLDQYVFPLDCQSCKRGLRPPVEWAVRDLYIAVVNETPSYWLPGSYTTFTRDRLATAAIPESARSTLGLLKTEIAIIGFNGFVDVCIVTGDLVSTLKIVSTNPDTPQLVLRLITRGSADVRRGHLENVPELLQAGGFDLIHFPVSLLTFPRSRKEESRSYVLVHLGMSELLDRGLALQIKYRLRLELLQLIIRHLRSTPLKRMRKDLRARGVRVSTQIVESVQGIINEGIVHLWRYSLPERYGRIHALPTDIDFRDYARRLDYYWRQANEKRNVKATLVAQSMLYTFIKNACIETLAAALGTGHGCELPQIAAGLVQGLPEYEELFRDLVEHPPDSLYTYDSDDIATFFKRVIVPHLATFSLIQQSEEDLQNSLGVFSRYINPYFWATKP